jgi:hypothetical protein
MLKKTTDGIEGWSSQWPSHGEDGGTLCKTRYEITSLKIAEQMVGVTLHHQKVKEWTLWRGRPLPNQKKYLLTPLV